jgi:hypothetical protein
MPSPSLDRTQPGIEEFIVRAKATGFSVEANPEASTILHYRDDSGEMIFCVEDIGLGGRKQVTLDWPRPVEDWATHSRERIGFQRTKRFLEALGFSVRVTPTIIEPNQPPEPTAASGRGSS